MSFHQSAYKYTERIDPKIKRRLRRSQEWQRKRDETVSRRRKIGAMSPFAELDNSGSENLLDNISEDKENKKTSKKRHDNDRLKMLQKWKEEKELKRKQAAQEKTKAKPFVVSMSKKPLKTQFELKFEQRLPKVSSKTKAGPSTTTTTARTATATTARTTRATATTTTTRANATTATTRTRAAATAAATTTTRSRTRQADSATTTTTTTTATVKPTRKTTNTAASATTTTTRPLTRSARTTTTGTAKTAAAPLATQTRRATRQTAAAEASATTSSSTRAATARPGPSTRSRPAATTTTTTKVDKKQATKRAETTTTTTTTTTTIDDDDDAAAADDEAAGQEMDIPAVPSKVTVRSDNQAAPPPSSFVSGDFRFTAPDNVQSYNFPTSLSPASTHSFFFGGFDDFPSGFFSKSSNNTDQSIGENSEDDEGSPSNNCVTPAEENGSGDKASPRLSKPQTPFPKGSVGGDDDEAVFKTPVSGSVRTRSWMGSLSDSRPGSYKKSRKSSSCHKMDSTKVPMSVEERLEILRNSPMIEMTRRKTPRHKLDEIPMFTLDDDDEEEDVIKKSLKNIGTPSDVEVVSPSTEEVTLEPVMHDSIELVESSAVETAETGSSDTPESDVPEAVGGGVTETELTESNATESVTKEPVEGESLDAVKVDAPILVEGSSPVLEGGALESGEGRIPEPVEGGTPELVEVEASVLVEGSALESGEGGSPDPVEGETLEAVKTDVPEPGKDCVLETVFPDTVQDIIPEPVDSSVSEVVEGVNQEPVEGSTSVEPEENTQESDIELEQTTAATGSTPPVSCDAVKPASPVSCDAVKPASPVRCDAVKPASPVRYDAVKPASPVSYDAVKPDSPVSCDAVKPASPVRYDAVKPDSPVSCDAVKPASPVRYDAVKPASPVRCDAVKPDSPVSCDAVKPASPVRCDAVKPDSPVSCEVEKMETQPDCPLPASCETVVQPEMVAEPQTVAQTETGAQQACPLPDSVEHDVPYFRNIVATQTALLNGLADTWEAIVPTLSEDVEGEVRTVIGQAKLLIAQRFHQFLGLVDNCEFKTGEKETTCEDLQGFWDMVDFQVLDVKKKFADLQKLKDNYWKVEEAVSCPAKPVKKLKKVKPSSSKAPKVQGRSKFAQFLAQKKKKVECSPVVSSSCKSEEPEDVKVFDGHFFRVESPVRSPKPHSRHGSPYTPRKILSQLNPAKIEIEQSSNSISPAETTNMEQSTTDVVSPAETTNMEQSTTDVVSPAETTNMEQSTDVVPPAETTKMEQSTTDVVSPTDTANMEQSTDVSPVDTTKMEQSTTDVVSPVDTTKMEQSTTDVVSPTDTANMEQSTTDVACPTDTAMEEESTDDVMESQEAAVGGQEEAVTGQSGAPAAAAAAVAPLDTPRLTPSVSRRSYIPAIPSPLLKDITPVKKRQSTGRLRRSCVLANNPAFTPNTTTTPVPSTRRSVQPDTTTPVPSTPTTRRSVQPAAATASVAKPGASVDVVKSPPRRRSLRLSRRLSAAEPHPDPHTAESSVATPSATVPVGQLIDIPEMTCPGSETNNNSVTPAKRRRSTTKATPEVCSASRRRSARISRLSVFNVELCSTKTNSHPDGNLIDFESPASKRRSVKRSKSVVFADSLIEEEGGCSAPDEDSTTVFCPVSPATEVAESLKESPRITRPRFGKLKVGYTPVRSRQGRRSSQLTEDEDEDN
ncbi:hypothetical protein Ahia01_000434200 [Argonauta hians]